MSSFGVSFVWECPPLVPFLVGWIDSILPKSVLSPDREFAPSFFSFIENFSFKMLQHSAVIFPIQFILRGLSLTRGLSLIT